MPSFDIVNRVDFNEVENTIKNTKLQLSQRYDFRGAKVEIDLDTKEKKIHIVSDDKMKMEAIRETFLAAAAKRGLNIKTFEWKDVLNGLAGSVKRDVVVKDGLEQDMAKKITKTIKESKIKVQASIQGEEVRVNGKKIDDLQEVIALLKADASIEVPLQFVNMKS